jgi:serine/threonine protein kinase
MTHDDAFYVGPESSPNKYRLIEIRGAGSEGEVWIAELKLSGRGRRRVAVKILRDDLIGRDDESWERHADLLRSVSHPGLVRVVEVFTGVRRHRLDESQTALYRFVVMDLAEGETLRDWLAKHPDSTLTERLRRLSTVAAALDEMHSGNQTTLPVAHGDFKPGNIVIRRQDGTTVLVDLGLMRIADGTVVVGRTAPYAAPELFWPGAEISPDTDRFAFAATVAHMILGEAPPVGGAGPDLDRIELMLSRHHLSAHRHMLRRQVMDALRAEPQRRPKSLSRWLSALIDSASKITEHELGETTTVRPPWAHTPASAAAPVVGGPHEAIGEAPGYGVDDQTTRSPTPPALTDASRGTVSATGRQVVLGVVALMILLCLVVGGAYAAGRWAGRTNASGGDPSGGVSRPALTSSSGLASAPSPTVTSSAVGTSSALVLTTTVPAAAFQSFSTAGSFAVERRETTITLPAPEGDYGALRGAFAQVQLCSGTLEFDFNVHSPLAPSPGYGLGIGPHGGVAAETPTGWSLQFEWNGSAYVTREANLPDDSTRTSTSLQSDWRPDTWEHVKVIIDGSSATMLMAGRPIAGSPFNLGSSCGGVLLRVWGTTVTVRNVKITSKNS